MYHHLIKILNERVLHGIEKEYRLTQVKYHGILHSLFIDPKLCYIKTILNEHSVY